MYHHKWDMEWLDNQVIFERDLFIDMLEEEVQAEKQRTAKVARAF